MSGKEQEKPRVGAVLLAAGSGTRFGAKKQFLELGDRPLFLWAFDALATAADELVVVSPLEDLDRVSEIVGETVGESAPAVVAARVVAGGARRQDSVRNGLLALGDEMEWALVHDAARPFVTAGDLERFVARMIDVGGAAIGYPSSDSVKEACDDALVARNLPRERVWLVQTPQGGRRGRLLEALDEAERRGVTVTDEASALELVGDAVALVEGPRGNIKVTRPEDLELARALISRGERT